MALLVEQETLVIVTAVANLICETMSVEVEREEEATLKVTMPLKSSSSASIDTTLTDKLRPPNPVGAVKVPETLKLVEVALVEVE